MSKKTTAKATTKAKQLAKLTKPARKPAKAPPAAKPAKRASEKPKQSSANAWALAAFVALEDVEGSWDGIVADAARFLYLRWRGLSATTPMGNNDDEVPKRPAGWVSWTKCREELEELAVTLPHRGHYPDGVSFGPCLVSPYMVRIAVDEEHPLFDSRGLAEPEKTLVASLNQFSGNFERILLVKLREQGQDLLYVDNGRQRVNGCRAVNAERVRAWYLKVCVDPKNGETPPALIEYMPAELLEKPMREAQAIAAAANSQRRNDSAVEMAERVAKLRAPTVGADGKEVPGYHLDEIATILGVSRGTVANLLTLRALAPRLWQELRSGGLPVACGYILGSLTADAHARQIELWDKVKGEKPGRRAPLLRALIAGTPATPAPPAARKAARPAPDLEAFDATLARCQGPGPTLARAVLAYAMGGETEAFIAALPVEFRTQFEMASVSEETPKARPKRWKDFDEDEQAAWEAAGVTSAIDAHLLSSFTPDQIMRTVEVGGVSMRIGDAYMRRLVTTTQIRILLRQLDLPLPEVIDGLPAELDDDANVGAAR